MSFVGFDLYQLGNLYQGENLSHEKVVEHLTISKVVNLFTTILEFPKTTTLTKQKNTF